MENNRIRRISEHIEYRQRKIRRLENEVGDLQLMMRLVEEGNLGFEDDIVMHEDDEESDRGFESMDDSSESDSQPEDEIENEIENEEENEEEVEEAEVWINPVDGAGEDHENNEEQENHIEDIGEEDRISNGSIQEMERRQIQLDEERRRREEEFDKEWGNGPAHDHLCLQYVYNEFVRKMIDKTNYIKDDNFADIMNALIANDDKENFEIMLNILDKYYLYLYTTNVIPRMAYCDAVRCFAFSVKHMNKWNPDRYQEARINPDDEIKSSLSRFWRSTSITMTAWGARKIIGWLKRRQLYDNQSFDYFKIKPTKQQIREIKRGENHDLHWKAAPYLRVRDRWYASNDICGKALGYVRITHLSLYERIDWN